MVEVGPGRGILTAELAKRGARVVAVEIDESLAISLDSRFDDEPNVTIINADARHVALDSLAPAGSPYKVVANLPYYAASPIIRRFLRSARRPESMVVMLQREVARTMVAAPGKMRLLSVMVQLHGQARIVASVPPGAFRPAPNVTSAIVRIDVYPRPAVAPEDEDRFLDLVKAGFSSPRKKIRNCLRQGLFVSTEAAEAILVRAGIDSNRRAETLAMGEWTQLFEAWREHPSADTSPSVNTALCSR